MVVWPLVVTPLTVEIVIITGGYVVVGVLDGAGVGAGVGPVDGAFDGTLDPDGTSLGVLLGRVKPGVDDAVGTPDRPLEGEISGDELGTAGKGVEDVANGMLLEDGKPEDDGVAEKKDGVTNTLLVLLESVKGRPKGGKSFSAGSPKGGTSAP